MCEPQLHRRFRECPGEFVRDSPLEAHHRQLVGDVVRAGVERAADQMGEPAGHFRGAFVLTAEAEHQGLDAAHAEGVARLLGGAELLERCGPAGQRVGGDGRLGAQEDEQVASGLDGGVGVEVFFRQAAQRRPQ
ncbi:hypothetical protein ACQ86I_20505 [Prescottella equi]